jgi:uncharacterized membrane protein YgcG
MINVTFMLYPPGYNPDISDNDEPAGWLRGQSRGLSIGLVGAAQVGEGLIGLQRRSVAGNAERDFRACRRGTVRTDGRRGPLMRKFTRATATAVLTALGIAAAAGAAAAGTAAGAAAVSSAPASSASASSFPGFGGGSSGGGGAGGSW